MRPIRCIGGFCLLAVLYAGCGEEEKAAPEPPQEGPAQVGQKIVPAIQEEDARKDALPKAPEPAAKPAAAALEGVKKTFQNIELPDSLRLAAARQLLRSGDRGDVAFLVENYGLRNNNLIERALIDELVGAGDEAVLPLLLGLFEQVGGEERIDFEQYLLRFGRRSEGRVMALLHAEDPSLVMRAVDTLAKMKSVAATDSIAALLAHPNSWVRMGAAHALGEINGPGSASYLRATLKDTAYAVVNAALVGLGRLRAGEAYEEVVALTRSENRHIRKHAAIALGELGDLRALPAVRALAEGDADSGVRFMAKKTLKKLEESP